MLAGLLASWAGFAQEQQPPVIQVNVSRVDVGAIVTGERGNFVEGLSRSNFHVFDDGVEQPLTDFAAVAEPATVLILLEAGPAVYLLQGGHISATYALLQHLAAEDRVALASYAEALAPVLNLTPDKQLVASALDNLGFSLGFGSLNLSASLAQALTALQTLSGKKSLVLLSTGFDTSPGDSHAKLVEQLRTSGVRIFTVSLNGPLRSRPAPTPPRRRKRGKTQPAPSNDKAVFTEEQFTQADALLGQIADLTGGRAFFPRDASQFAAAYTQIADLVRHEYSLAFAPPASDGRLHSITVKVDPIEPAGGNSTPAGSRAKSLPYHVAYRQAYLAPSN